MKIPRCLLVCFLAASCVVSDNEPPPAVQAPTDPAEEDHSEEHSEEHGAGTQTINLFFGGSGEVGDLDGFTFGVDYGYRIGPRWGVAAFAETVTGLDRSFAAGVGAFWHPIGEWGLFAGPGLERNHDEWGALGRVGTYYEFFLDDGWVLTPAVYYDFSEHTDLLIYGAYIGYAW